MSPYNLISSSGPSTPSKESSLLSADTTEIGSESEASPNGQRGEEKYEPEGSFEARIWNDVHSVIERFQVQVSQTTKNRSWIVSLLPTFIRNRGFSHPSDGQLHKNAALDGLRGWACFFVFCNHYTNVFALTPHFGWNGTPGRDRIVQWPYVRLIWSGSSWVAVFFAISGYVLSYKSIKLMRLGDVDQVFHTLTSSIFRRGIRLYLPTLISLITAFFLVRLGFFVIPDRIYRDRKYMVTIEDCPPTLATFALQWAHFYKALREWMWFWKWGNNIKPVYDVHVWTIPYEYCSSMLLFLVLAGTARLYSRYRMLVSFGLILYCIDSGIEIPMLFIAGMLLAEIDLVLQDRAGPQIRTTRPQPLQTPSTPSPASTSASEICLLTPLARYIPSPRIRTYLSHLSIPRIPTLPSREKAYICLFFFALFLSSCPEFYYPDSTVFGFLTTNFSPPNYVKPFFFYHSLGAILLVHLCTQSTFLKPLFTNPFAQYLGRISYALYIVHGNVQKIFLYPMMPWLWHMTGGYETNRGYWSGVVFATLVHWPLQFWVADLFWRGIDIPSVKFGRWLENKLTMRM